MLQRKTYENWAEALLDYDHAECPDTGATMRPSYGNSRSGRAPKWFVSFRKSLGLLGFSVRAWTLDQAIEEANKKLMKQYAKAVKQKRLENWYEFIDTDQQAMIAKRSTFMVFERPDDHARLWAHPTPASPAGAAGEGG